MANGSVREAYGIVNDPLDGDQDLELRCHVRYVCTVRWHWWVGYSENAVVLAAAEAQAGRSRDAAQDRPRLEQDSIGAYDDPGL